MATCSRFIGNSLEQRQRCSFLLTQYFASVSFSKYHNVVENNATLQQEDSMRLDELCRLGFLNEWEKFAESFPPVLSDAIYRITGYDAEGAAIFAGLCIAGSDLTPEHAKLVCEEAYKTMLHGDSHGLLVVAIAIVSKHDSSNFQERLSQIYGKIISGDNDGGIENSRFIEDAMNVFGLAIP